MPTTWVLSRRMVVAFLFPSICVAFLVSSAAASDDASALLEFQRGIQQSQTGCLAQTWSSSKLGSSGCPDSWCGVTCDSNGNVIALELTGLGLVGTIRPGSIANLPMLASLVLSNNLLTGNLPDDLGKLVNLKLLDLSDNLLSGSIPSSFDGLQSLVNLSLAGNSLSGLIPPSLHALQHLISLNLSSNSFGGTIPAELALLPNLSEFDLHNNQLSGGIDPALLTFPALRTVDLSCNNLWGFIPWQPNDTLPLLSTVQSVNLSNNQLTGPLAQEKFSTLFALKLTVLDMSSNQLSGNLPDFQFVFSLKILRLRNNSFSGAVPSLLLSATLGVLEEVDLSMNNLTGEIDSVTSTSLQILNLSSNLLYGAVPTRIGRCTVVDLSHNKFNGNLSPLHGWGDSLEILDLSFNDLTGGLPELNADFVRLRNLNISHNGLLGPIPLDYGLLQKMSVIDLSFNQLNGTIPGSLFNSSALSYLSLSNNQLSGSIPLQGSLSFNSVLNLPPSSTIEYPAQVDQVSQILVIDLSNNKLDGNISEEIGRFQGLEILDLSNNQLSGRIPNALSNLTMLQDLDLSGNQLTGSIPETLPKTLRELHLSNNNLSGTIPANLRGFPPSSFFPGNEGLSAPWLALPAPEGPERPFGTKHRRGIGTAVKAGLIGGCTAGLALVVAVGLLLYYKSLSKPQDYGRGSEFGTNNTDAGKGHKMWSPCAAYFAFHDHAESIPPVMSFSADLLLAPGKASPAAKYRGTSREARNPWAQDASMEADDSSKLIGMEMSPSRTRQKSSPGSNNYYESSRPSEEFLPADSPIILKVRSPDRLAGDLYFLDNTVTFTAEELSRAPAEVLGRSSHGTSYKATLDNGHMLTVKWLREGLAKSKKEFAREAKKFGKVRHPNIIPFRGYYWGPREHEKLILSDYMGSGSLAAHLSERTVRRFPPLSWQQRLVIAVDIARGLVYLHCERHLPHGNLKATNVLLDGPNLNGRLADYSLHQLMTSEGTANQILNAGALGYRAPELATMRKPKPSFKGDVYAFGVLMMELSTGKGAGDIISGHCGAVDLTDWVRLLATEGRTVDCFDPSLVGTERDQEPPKGMDEMLALALKCISSQSDRPNIRTVYGELASISA